MAKINIETNFSAEEIAIYNSAEGYVQSEHGNAEDFFASKIKQIVINAVSGANKRVIMETKQEEARQAALAIEASIVSKVSTTKGE